METEIAFGGEFRLSVEEHICYVAGHFVGLLLLFLLGRSGWIALVIVVDMLANIAERDTPLDMLAGSLAHFVRGAQSVGGLQSEGSSPYVGFLFDFRTLGEIFVKVLQFEFLGSFFHFL